MPCLPRHMLIANLIAFAVNGVELTFQTGDAVERGFKVTRALLRISVVDLANTVRDMLSTTDVTRLCHHYLRCDTHSHYYHASNDAVHNLDPYLENCGTRVHNPEHCD